MNWKDDHRWSMTYLNAIRAIVGPKLLQPANLQKDQEEATDLLVLKASDMRIACRIRRPQWRIPKYLRQFTIRSGRTSGAKTELAKIVEGWGDWLFYAFALDDQRLNPWCIIDLAAFRAHLICDGQRPSRQLRYAEQQNTDQQTSFCWFDIDSFTGDPPLLIASEATT